ncbi:hypothetical protein DB891_15605 [Flavobacterium laiguense]|uniref:Putative auto-transporter adhesin head GIN domain-containing protein n=1 Tax=Flavobacterium laiguense TaxID=2169409 RepID=A0A2U1JNC6_9FLAO|nr:hypothetical protein DB891_15605 [Flavobacterium laiguense]
MIFGQNKERINGSKIVIENPKGIGEFTALEIEDNLTVFMKKGAKNQIKIEADDNLQKGITPKVENGVLVISCKYRKLINIKSKNITVK